MNTADTLELILSCDKTCLAKIASTCKKWNVTNSMRYDEEKMYYLQDEALRNRKAVFIELDKEMFNVSNGFVSYDDYCSDWRDAEDENELQDNWYAFREYSFFYDFYHWNLSSTVIDNNIN